MGGCANPKTYLLLAAFSLTMFSTASAKIVYVDPDAPGSNDGSSWTNAYNFLQDALADANSAVKPVEIRVAQGIYTPDSNSANPNGSGDREATFHLINGVNLKGGYAGNGTPDPNSRDIELYETILSGDLNGNDIEVNDPCDLLTETTRADNCYHVVSSNNCDPNAVLDGVAITGGNAKCCYKDDFGGGIYNDSGSPTISNCTFVGNAAFWGGGGMYNSEGSPALTNCTFIGNLAGWIGGGLDNAVSSSPTITNCTFSGNLSRGFGGGMINHYSSPTVTNCTFSGNRANWSGGGGMYNFQGNPVVTHCKFSGNSADSGGGMRNYESSPTVTNCTFCDHSTLSGGGMANDYNSNPIVTNCAFINNTASYNGAGMTNYLSSPTVTNCKFINNSAVNGGGMVNSEGASPKVTNCIFKGNLALDSPSVSGGWGGGILNYLCSPTFINCTFSSNSAKYGGGIYNWCSSTLTVKNCTFTGNSAGLDGGGLHNYYDSISTVTNCTFTGNSTGFDGGGLYNDFNSTSTVTNCILWDNTAGDLGPEVALGSLYGQNTVYISYCDIQSGKTAVYDPCEMLVWEAGNIDVDPCFVDSGYWDPNGTPEDANDDFWVKGDYQLLQDSYCIDAGDPNYIAEPNETDLDGNPRVMGGRIDMGAYEYNPTISAEVKIVPRTINLASKGKWITAFLWLPEDYNVIDIDSSSVLLEDEIEPQWVWFDEEEQVAMIMFSRGEVRDILTVGEIGLTITGRLTDGTIFEAKDVIIVIDKGSRKTAKQEKTK